MKNKKIIRYGLITLFLCNILMLTIGGILIYKVNYLYSFERKKIIVDQFKSSKSIYIDNNVKLFGAVGDGVADDSDAIQKALDEKKVIYIPSGRYYLSKPLKVSGGMAIYGDNGGSPTASETIQGSQTVLLPKSVGITVKDNEILSQSSDFILENIAFLGGSNCVDLPLFHLVKIRNCSFRDFSKCGIVIVRGEKIELHSLFFYNQNVTSDKNISLASIEDSVHKSKLEKFQFGSAGTWIDRISMQDITNQKGDKGNFNYGLYCGGTLSNCFIDNLLYHGGIKRAVNINTLQASDLSTIALDTCGSDEKPMDYCVYIGKMLNSTITNVQPAFGGTVRAKTQFYIGSGFGSTLNNCYANGDNNNNFGFKIGNSVGQSITFVGCNGSLYSEAGNEIIKRQLTIIGGTLKTNFSGANTNVYGESPYSVNFMADSNGSKQGELDFQLSKSSGEGNPKVQFRVTDNYIQLGNIKIIIGEGNPNGVIDAPTGSMFIDQKGAEGKTLYVKESNIDKTKGWISK